MNVMFLLVQISALSNDMKEDEFIKIFHGERCEFDIFSALEVPVGFLWFNLKWLKPQF